MVERLVLSDILKRVTQTGQMLGLMRSTGPDLLTLCSEIVSDRGEVSGLVTANEILDQFEVLDDTGQMEFFQEIAAEFGVDNEAVEQAVAKWAEITDERDGSLARAIHDASEPLSQELIRRINRAPGATARLVGMRAKLTKFTRDHPELRDLDRDFLHLFSSWFNRGFLEIQRITWTTPASILEKIIAYEAVHEISGWDDLRQRVASDDRRLFAFFHPAMPDDPLIFIEVAIMSEIATSIGEIITTDREGTDPEKASVAVFYSISNCQKGLRGISFGNFLIKQVVAELKSELPDLSVFVTLSPVPGLRRWLKEAPQDDPVLIGMEEIDRENPAPNQVASIAARYLTRARRKGGTAFDPVAHFHLGNGATLHAVHSEADTSAAGKKNSWGIMVNYLYDASKIEANHQAYANQGKIAAAPKVLTLAK